MKDPIINQGTVRFKGDLFTYRSFLSQPIGMAHLFPHNKPAAVLQMELEIMAKNDPSIKTVNIKGLGAHEVFWDEDGTCELSVGTVDLFADLEAGKLTDLEAGVGFSVNAGWLQDIYFRAKSAI